MNKAHKATTNRLAKIYDAVLDEATGLLRNHALTIRVETQASLAQGLRQLYKIPGLVYLAVTNKEAIADALALTAQSDIGVMDPQGYILRESARSCGA